MQGGVEPQQRPWENVKMSNIFLLVIPEEWETENEAENILGNKRKKLPNLMKDIIFPDSQCNKSQEKYI